MPTNFKEPAYLSKPAPTPHRYIFLNGPPGSGKDTAANFILHEYSTGARHMKFASVLKNAARELFCMDMDLFANLEKVGHAYDKTVPRDELMGMSWREALIWLSEEAVKPKFGPAFFGVQFAKIAAKPTLATLTVVSDCGFAEELLPVVKQVGAPNCHVIRLVRQGHDFDGDSRNYISMHNELPDKVTFHDVNNFYDRSMFRVQILSRVNKILGGDRMYD